MSVKMSRRKTRFATRDESLKLVDRTVPDRFAKDIARSDGDPGAVRLVLFADNGEVVKMRDGASQSYVCPWLLCDVFSLPIMKVTGEKA